MRKLNKILQFIRRQPRWRQITAILVLVLAGWWGLRSGTGSGPQGPTFATRRGALEINVLEGGSLEALESQEAKCEVRVGNQGTKILKIVEEGYFVTEADVKNGKVLVELDSSDLEKQQTQQEIQYQQSVASLIDAQQNYEIQLNQNETDIKAAEQKARFARMDFDKFLGANVSAQIIKDYGLDKILTEASTNDVEQTMRAEEASLTTSLGTDPALVLLDGGQNENEATNISANLATAVPATDTGVATPTATAAPDPGAKVTDAEPRAFPTGIIDFSKYANVDMLGDGEAKQKLRKFEDDLQAAQKELGQAKATLDGTRRLFDKQFVARTELVRDQLSQDSAELKVKTAETARDLYLKYDFAKTAEQALSDYTDAVRSLDKARRVAISKLAQARARLRSAQGQYTVQIRQRNDLIAQLGKCTIRAQKIGLVVYGGSGRDYYGSQDPIREGTTVRERQSIFTIPDMTHMAVNVSIHESYIKKIKKGLPARITVDAFPNTILTGEISKVGVLPDSQNRWMNPDMMVYVTTITINGTYDWVKPGMSAKVEILVNKLEDVVYIPVQAVTADNGRQYCFVAGAFKPERREIQVGEFNDDFIEIKRGLREGERVLLQLPQGVETDGTQEASPTSETPPDQTSMPNVSTIYAETVSSVSPA